MGELLKTFSAILGIAVLACLLMGGGLPILIFAGLGYVVGMWFVNEKLN
jgi:hypothetical protein